MQPAPSKARMHRLLFTTVPHAPAMPSRQPPSSSPPSSLPSSSSSPSSPGAPAPAAAAAGCLPADQSCFAVSVSAGAPSSYTSRRDAAGAATASSAHACCTATSYIAVLGISFGSLLAILLILCAIRWYLVQRSASREAAESAAAAAEPDKKRSTGLDADAIAALPEFAYRKEEAAAAGDEAEERECAVCLAALAEGEAARLLPLCMHVFHRGCVDVWLRERSTCPVCRAEVVARRTGEGCGEKEQEGGTSRASTSTAAATAPLPPQDRMLEDEERDLEAQL